MKTEKVNLDVEKIYRIAMANVKATGKKLLDASHAEAVKFRLAEGLDEGGHPIKVIETDPVTGEVIKKKRGRKPKVKAVTTDPAITKDVGLTAKISKKSTLAFPVSTPVEEDDNDRDYTCKRCGKHEADCKCKASMTVKPIKTKVVKSVKTKVVKEIKKSIKKKEKFVPKGRVASIPALIFNNESLEVKSKMFDEVMVARFGKDKYNGKILVDGGQNVTIKKSISPKGAFVVEMETKNASVKFYEYIELNKLYMSKIVNYAHYLKPIKK